MVFHVDFNELPVARPVRVLQGDTYREPYELEAQRRRAGSDGRDDHAGCAASTGSRRRPGKA